MTKNIIPLLELRIPEGEVMRLPSGWTYASKPRVDQRILVHKNGPQILVTESEADETVDAEVIRMMLKLAEQ